MVIGFNPNTQNAACSCQFDATGECKLVLECPPARFEICGVGVSGSLRGGCCCGRDCDRSVFATEEIEGSRKGGGGRK